MGHLANVRCWDWTKGEWSNDIIEPFIFVITWENERLWRKYIRNCARKFKYGTDCSRWRQGRKFPSFFSAKSAQWLLDTMASGELWAGSSTELNHSGLSRYFSKSVLKYPARFVCLLDNMIIKYKLVNYLVRDHRINGNVLSRIRFVMVYFW